MCEWLASLNVCVCECVGVRFREASLCRGACSGEAGRVRFIYLFLSGVVLSMGAQALDHFMSRVGNETGWGHFSWKFYFVLFSFVILHWYLAWNLFT